MDAVLFFAGHGLGVDGVSVLRVRIPLCGPFHLSDSYLNQHQHLALIWSGTSAQALWPSQPQPPWLCSIARSS